MSCNNCFMYISKFLVRHSILILAFAISLASCSHKKVPQSTTVSNEVAWQYSNHLYGLENNIKNKFTINDFFISRVGGSLSFPLISYPIIGKDYIIVMDHNGVVARINNITKAIDWKHISNQKFHFFGDYLNGGLSQKEEKIYVTYGTNLINCIDSRTGNLVWSKTLQEVVRAYPMVSRDTIFLQTLNNGIYALNTENGNVIWYKAGQEKDVNVVNVISPILYPHKDWLITQGSTGNLIVINSKTGFEEWSIDNGMHFDMSDNHLAGEKAIIYQPIVVNDDLYFYSSNGYFYKLSLQNKSTIWKVKLNINRPFYVLNNIIMVIDEAANLIAIKTNNGSEMWKIKLNDYLEAKEKRKTRYWNSPVIINENVYILSSKGELLNFDLYSGKFIKATYNMGYGSYIPPIYADNKAFIISAK